MQMSHRTLTTGRLAVAQFTLRKKRLDDDDERDDINRCA